MYYKYINGEIVSAPNGVILPNTTEPTLDKNLLEAEGWQEYNEEPIKLTNNMEE